MAALLFQHLQRRPRQFRERKDPFLLSDGELIERYRFPRAGIEDIIGLVRDDVTGGTLRSNPLSAKTQVLATLRYLAKGDFFSEIGDIHGISRSSVSRSVERVIGSINVQMDNIKFPRSTQEIDKTKQAFYRVAGLPNVIGAVDGTLVPIIAPTEDEDEFVCRKGYHALNVQAVADMDMRFTDVVSKWPGSQHDAQIFDDCGLKETMETRNNCWLLGDSGYPLRNYLITPVGNPSTPAEVSFNKAHSRSRMVVERAFGVLKSRFRCLHKTGGCLPFKPGKSAHVVAACFRLHNKCIDDRLPEPELVDLDDAADNNVLNDLRNEENGRQTRQRLINNYV